MTKFKRFEKRIERERSILTFINSKSISPTPLCGLTIEAIENWIKSIEGVSKEEAVGKLGKLLKKIPLAWRD